MKDDQLTLFDFSTVVQLCHCGCQQLVERRKDGGWFKYCDGHEGAGVTKPPIGVVAPRCKCGECDRRVGWNKITHAWNDYVRGHIFKTQKGKDIATKNIAIQNAKQWNDPVYRAYMSELGRIQMEKNWQNDEFREMRSRVATEQFSTSEARQASRDRMNKLREDPEFCKNVAEAARKMCLERWKNKEFREMMTETARETMTKNSAGWWADEEFRANRFKQQSNRMKELWQNPEYRKQREIEMEEAWSNPERRAQVSQRFKDLWKQEDYIKDMMEKRGRRPNGLETKFDDLTCGKIKYVGDGTFFKTWPNGRIKNPDFRVYDQDGEPVKRIIELFGDYYHQDDDVQLHIEMWHRIGYEVLIIWESELKKDQEGILDLVSNFIGEEARIGE